MNLTIPIVSLTANISRYSKESTLTDRGGANLEDTVSKWLDEVVRSDEEDEQGVDRRGVDPYLAESVSAFRVRLQDIGDVITLDQFPFDQVPASVKEHAVRALQKEIAGAIKRLKDLNVIQYAQLYADSDLTDILTREFGS